MKIKSFIQIVAFGLYFSGLAILSVGCLSYQTFSGPALPRNQIAVLNLENAPDSLRVTSVDGAVVDLYPGVSIQLLPGKHTLSFFPITTHSYLSGGAMTKTIWVEAGRTYFARAEVIRLETWRGVPVPFEERLNAHDVKWRVVIAEK